MLGDVEETIYVVEEDEDDDGEGDEEDAKVKVDISPCERPSSLMSHDANISVQTINKQSEMLFVRGNTITDLSPSYGTCLMTF